MLQRIAYLLPPRNEDMKPCSPAEPEILLPLICRLQLSQLIKLSQTGLEYIMTSLLKAEEAGQNSSLTSQPCLSSTSTMRSAETKIMLTSREVHAFPHAAFYFCSYKYFKFVKYVSH